jgi:hypothetical protein
MHVQKHCGRGMLRWPKVLALVGCVGLRRFAQEGSCNAFSWVTVAAAIAVLRQIAVRQALLCTNHADLNAEEHALPQAPEPLSMQVCMLT